MSSASSRPDLTVVVCTRNRAARLPIALEAVLRALAHVRGELIVVDNGSTDQTPAVLARTPGLRVVVEPVPGLSRARNTGIVAARGAWVAFTDDDCVPAEDWAARLLASTPGAAAVGGRVLPDRAALIPWWMRTMRGPLVRHDLGPEPRPYRRRDAKFIGANMAFARGTFARHGLFREDLGHGTGLLGEDSEMCRRLRRAGEPCHYAGDALVHHYTEPERLTAAYVARWYGRKLREVGHRGLRRLRGRGQAS